MHAALSLTSLAIGAALSYGATRSVRGVAALEAWSGGFLVVGLILVGSGLPLFR